MTKDEAMKAAMDSLESFFDVHFKDSDIGTHQTIEFKIVREHRVPTTRNTALGVRNPNIPKLTIRYSSEIPIHND